MTSFVLNWVFIFAIAVLAHDRDFNCDPLDWQRIADRVANSPVGGFALRAGEFIMVSPTGSIRVGSVTREDPQRVQVRMRIGSDGQVSRDLGSFTMAPIYSAQVRIFHEGESVGLLVDGSRRVGTVVGVNRSGLIVVREGSESISVRADELVPLRREAPVASVVSRPSAAERTSPVQRRYPPLGDADTIIQIAGKTQSIHTQGQAFPFIRDEEILQIHQPTGSQTVGTTSRRSGIEIVYTADGRSVIQQQGTRGCTAAATAMLITDNNGIINVETVRYRNIGTPEGMVSDLRAAGFEPSIRRTSGSTPSERVRQIAQAVSEQGSAIIDVTTEIGGHVIVVDAIDYRTGVAQIRDPWHGWAIAVPISSLEARVGFQTAIIQIPRHQRRARQGP